ncbi:hypothetical protein [Nonomuraea fuscirosea]|uniref:hypothetical protein n=1 Tax=Nonomuraea fuscirosea TaxID=1291556 RepID=UPI00342C189B
MASLGGDPSRSVDPAPEPDELGLVVSYAAAFTNVSAGLRPIHSRPWRPEIRVLRYHRSSRSRPRHPADCQMVQELRPRSRLLPVVQHRASGHGGRRRRPTGPYLQFEAPLTYRLGHGPALVTEPMKATFLKLLMCLPPS